MKPFNVEQARFQAEALCDPNRHFGPANRGFAGYVLALACDEIESLRNELGIIASIPILDAQTWAESMQERARRTLGMSGERTTF